MFTISYYENVRKAKTSSGAIRAAKEMTAVYGRAGKSPVISVGTQEEADDLVSMMEVAKVQYSVRIGGQAVER